MMIKVFSGGLDMWRVGKIIGLLRESVGECASSRSVGRPRKRWIGTVKECLIKKRFRCQASKENGAG